MKQFGWHWGSLKVEAVCASSTFCLIAAFRRAPTLFGDFADHHLDPPDHPRNLELPFSILFQNRHRQPATFGLSLLLQRVEKFFFDFLVKSKVVLYLTFDLRTNSADLELLTPTPGPINVVRAGIMTSGNFEPPKVLERNSLT